MSSPPPLLPSLELVRRSVAAELAYTVSRLQLVERKPGNPYGVAIRHLEDGATALMARRIPVPHFNTVVGLRTGHETQIEGLAAWYREGGVSGRFELVPGLHDEKLGRALHEAGYFHSGFHVSLLSEARRTASPLPAETTIELVIEEAQIDDFFDAYWRGWNFQHGGREDFKANVRGWRGLPGWSLYLARVDGKPAATAALFMHEGVGYCADAAVDPAFRGRGLQRTLLTRRIADAASAGADFVCSGAEFLSPSHRNMAGIGMRMQFTRAVWTKAA